MNVVRKRLTQLTPAEYRACHAANFHSRASMQGDLRNNKNNPDAYAIMIWKGPRNTNKNLIGWSLLIPKKSAPDIIPRRSKYHTQYWVKAQYRRHGYGKMLVNYVRAVDPHPYVIPHDLRSASMFASVSGVSCHQDDRSFMLSIKRSNEHAKRNLHNR